MNRISNVAHDCIAVVAVINVCLMNAGNNILGLVFNFFATIVHIGGNQRMHLEPTIHIHSFIQELVIVCGLNTKANFNTTGFIGVTFAHECNRRKSNLVYISRIVQLFPVLDSSDGKVFGVRKRTLGTKTKRTHVIVRV